MKRLGTIFLALGLVAGAGAPAWADSLFTPGPNDNLTGFNRPYLGVGDLVTVVVTENNTAESGANTTTSKDSELNPSWDFGSLIPTIAKSGIDLHGKDSFTGQGTTTRDGKLQMDIASRIEEVLPNGTLRIVGHKEIRVNDEDTDITIHGIVRPLDISPENTVDSSAVADMQVEYKGSGPVGAKATPGILTRVLNWLF